MSKTTDEWLKWAWVYGSLTVERFPSLSAALAARWGSQDDESFVCIEGPEGVVSRDVVEADEEARWEAERARWSERPSPICGIRLAGPNGESRYASWGRYLDRAEAEAEAAELRERFGDRVTVVDINPARRTA